MYKNITGTKDNNNNNGKCNQYNIQRDNMIEYAA